MPLRLGQEIQALPWGACVKEDRASVRVRDQSRMSIRKLAPNLRRCRDPETAAWGIVRDPDLALDYADEALTEDALGFHLAFGELRQHRVSLFLLLKSLMQRLLVVWGRRNVLDFGSAARAKLPGAEAPFSRFQSMERRKVPAGRLPLLPSLGTAFFVGASHSPSVREENIHICSPERLKSSPSRPSCPNSDPGDSGNSGNFLVGPARKNRNFLATGRREPRDLALE